MLIHRCLFLLTVMDMARGKTAGWGCDAFSYSQDSIQPLRPLKLYTRLVLFTLVLSVALLDRTANAAQAQPTLEFSNDPIKMVLGSSKPGSQGTCDPQAEGNVRSAYPTVFVVLGDSETPRNLEFLTKVLPDTGERGNRTSYDDTTDSDPANGSVDVCLADPDKQSPIIEPSQVKPVDLIIDIYLPSKPHGFFWYLGRTNLPDEALNLSGNLIVKDTASETVVPGMISLQLRRVAPGYRGCTLTGILLSALAWSIVIAVVGLIRTRSRGKWSSLKTKLTFVFKTGWATNLTTTGVLLGTFLSAQVLPGETFFMSKTQYITLNLMFGLFVLFASAIHNSLSYGWVFLAASAVTLGAGLGELATVILLVQEMGFQSSVPVGGVRIIQAVLIALTAIVTVEALDNALTRIWDPTIDKTGTV